MIQLQRIQIHPIQPQTAANPILIQSNNTKSKIHLDIQFLLLTLAATLKTGSQKQGARFIMGERLILLCAGRFQRQAQPCVSMGAQFLRSVLVHRVEARRRARQRQMPCSWSAAHARFESVGRGAARRCDKCRGGELHWPNARLHRFF